MDNILNTPENSLQVDNCKDIKYLTQYRIVRQFLYQNTASRYMVTIYTGVPIQNVCRYVDMLRKHNAIAVIRKDKCRISKEWVEFLSPNPANFPKCSQLELWDESE